MSHVLPDHRPATRHPDPASPPVPGAGPGAAPTHPPAVEVVDVTKSYGPRPVLTGLSLAAAPGEILGLLGANGAGKTTAVEIVQGLRNRDGGRVRVLGLDPATERGRLRHLVGSQLQSSALPDRLRVGEALRLFARLAGDVVDWRELRDEWRLTPLERRAFAALSGGERQRLFVALALVNRPRVVFLDELTQGLDPAARRETWQLIERVRDQGTTVVLVTHFMDEAERLCDRVAVLHEGRIAACAPPADLVARAGAAVHVRFSAPTGIRAGDADDPAGLVTRLDRLPGVLTVTPPPPPGPAPRMAPGLVDVACRPDAPAAVIAELHHAGLSPVDLAVDRPSLEDAFVALTEGGTR